MVVLGVVELRRVHDLGRDVAVAGGAAAAPRTDRGTSRRPRAERPSSRRSRSGTGCPRRCPGACPGSGRGSPRRSGAAPRRRSPRGGTPRAPPRCGRSARCRPPRRWGSAYSRRRSRPRSCRRPAPARSSARRPRSSPPRRRRSRPPRGRAARAACGVRSGSPGRGRAARRAPAARRPAPASRSCHGRGSSYIQGNVRLADGTGLFRAGPEGRSLSRGRWSELRRRDVAREVRPRLLRARPRGRLVLPPHEERDLPGPADRGDVRRRGGAAARADAAQHPPHQR